MASQPHPPGAPRATALGLSGGLLAMLLSVPVSGAAPVTFDFDSGAPSLALHATLPLDQAVQGMTAHFSAGDASSFSIQDRTSMFPGLVLSPFSGSFLVPGVSGTNNVGGFLEIRFSQRISTIEFPFATIQVPPIETETPLTLAAYLGSASLPPVGVTRAAGRYGGVGGLDTWPTGTLRFHSDTPFNLVRIFVENLNPPPPGGQATDFTLDSVSVEPAGGPACAISGAPSPAAGGRVIGGGGYSIGLDATLLAIPNLGYAFRGWAEGGTIVSTNRQYSFTAVGDRELAALFDPASYLLRVGNTPPGGGSVSPSGMISLPAGASLGVSASPAPGFVFSGWRQGSGILSATNWVGTNPVFQITAEANLTLVAQFAPGNQLTLSALPPEGGVLVGDATYPPGAPVNVSATPNPGFRFDGWTDAVGGAAAAASRTLNLAGNTHLVARFAPLLALERDASQQLFLKWPRATPEYILLESATADAAAWSRVQQSPSDAGGGRRLLVAPLGASRFFRLEAATP